MKKKPTPQAPPLTTPAPVSKALLGCGILILIAQAVVIFSIQNRDKETEKQIAGQFSSLRAEIGQLSSNVGNLKSDVGDLKTGLTRLQSGIEKQAQTLEQIRKSLMESSERNARMRPRVIPAIPRDGTEAAPGTSPPPPAEKPPLESIPLPGNQKKPTP